MVTQCTSQIRCSHSYKNSTPCGQTAGGDRDPHIYLHVSTYIHIHTHPYIYMHIYTHTPAYIYSHIYTHILYAYIYIQAHAYCGIHTHIYIYTRTHTHASTYMHIYAFAYKYIYIHTHTHTCTYMHIHIQPIPPGVTPPNAATKPKAQSSNAPFHRNVAKETFELWASSPRKWHPKWDQLYLTTYTYGCIHTYTYSHVNAHMHTYTHINISEGPDRIAQPKCGRAKEGPTVVAAAL